MRKPRDFEAELKALDDKARLLKERKRRQLGELVIACGADALPIEQLAGVLLSAVDNADLVTKEAWRQRGAAFFRQTPRPTVRGAGRGSGSEPADVGGTKPAAGGPHAS